MKSKKKKIILICTECYSRNYTLNRESKNKLMEMKKHCPKCNKHTLHKETR